MCTRYLVETCTGLPLMLQLFCYSLSADDSTTFRMKVSSEAEHFTDLSKVSPFCVCLLTRVLEIVTT